MNNDAVKSAWHFIEDAYGVGELSLFIDDGRVVRICNDNPQQLLEVSMGQGGDVIEYTHIESWLSDVDAKILQSIINVSTKTTSDINMQDKNVCPKRLRSSEIPLPHKHSRII